MKPKHIKDVIIIAAACATIFTFLIVVIIPRLSSVFAGGTATSTPASTPTPTATPVQTTNLLYEAGNGKGWSGWNGTNEWYINGDLLMSKGTDDDTSPEPTITAPYQVNSTNNYAIEATVRILGGNQGCFYLAIRGSDTATQWSGYKTAACVSMNFLAIQDSLGNMLKYANFTPDNGYHIYRIQVKGSSIQASVDGGANVQVSDTSVPSGNQVGIKTYGGQIEVSDFKIISI